MREMKKIELIKINMPAIMAHHIENRRIRPHIEFRVLRYARDRVPRLTAEAEFQQDRLEDRDRIALGSRRTPASVSTTLVQRLGSIFRKSRNGVSIAKNK